jgi:hypothetical protein
MALRHPFKPYAIIIAYAKSTSYPARDIRPAPASRDPAIPSAQHPPAQHSGADSQDHPIAQCHLPLDPTINKR